MYVQQGQIPVRSDRRSPEREPWRDLDSLEGVVEEQFVSPILLGDSILPFALRGDRRAVVPWDGGKLLSGSDEEIDAHPGLADWWRRAERLFDEHKSETTTLDLVGQIDYQGKLHGQFPLAEHRIAYTGRGEIVTAARITNPEAVVDHALYWAAFDTETEARYICGVINSKALQSRIAESLSRGQFGGRNIHRAPFLIPWPAFDAADDLHQRIAAATARAEQVANQAGEGGGIAAARNRVRDALAADGVAGELEELVEELLGAAASGDGDD